MLLARFKAFAEGAFLELVTTPEGYPFAAIVGLFAAIFHLSAILASRGTRGLNLRLAFDCRPP